MVERIIETCAKNKWLVLLLTAGLVVAALYAIVRIPLDAIPDLSDTQVIVGTEWMGRSPDLIEDQITYPIVSSLLAAPKVKTVRGYSMFGMSFVYVLFQDGTDLYWARSRVLEYLSQLKGRLPAEANPVLGPDATGVGWIYEYALVDETGKHDLAELRSLQDYWLKYALESVSGVAEVASVGGYVKQYQVTLDPDRLRAYSLPIAALVTAIKRSNNDVGGRVVEMSGREYVVRGLGYLRSTADLEKVVVGENGGTPIHLGDVARVAVGPDIRRGAVELNGRGEVVGGIVVMRDKENALNVIRRVKDRLNEQIIPSLPPGVKLVTTYDRSDIILASIHTLTRALIEEAIVVSLIIILFLLHIRSALVAIITLPVAVLASFVPMLFLGLTSNIMSLGGIAIAIGVMVDAAIVLVENAHKKIEHAPPDADRVPLIIQAAKEVGRPIFFSLILIAVSFLPVFTLQGQGGRLFIPLAFTKTAAMFFAALLSITLSPALMVLLIRGRIFKETEHPVSRFLIRVYKPFVYVALHNPKTTLLIAAAAVASAVPLGLRIGSEFMPPLNEGSLLYMPTTLPGVSIEQARESLQTQDQIIASFPEVSSVFGKVGRADTATDPAGLDMAETVILVKPRDQWRSITVHRWYSSWAPAWLQSLLRPLWPESRPRTWAELTEELNRALNMPGWTNSLSPPIKTRIDMLTTGIRTPIGIKVYSDSLQRIEDAAQRLESTLRNIPGTRSVFAERATGGYYLDIIPNREVLARYGLNVGDVQDVIEAALGGLTVTRTVEGRERYTVNVRYPRDYRRDADTVRRILVPIRTNAGSAGAPSSGMGMTRNAPPNPGVMVAQNMGGGMGGGSTPSSGGGGVAAPGSTATDIPLFQLPPLPSGAGAGFQSPGGMGAAGSAASSSSPTARLAMVPLGQLAEVTLRTGPPMIKDENGSLVGYVYVDVDTSKRDIGGYVEEAKRTVRDALGPLPGIRLEWTGQYELLQRLSERLRFVVPLTLALIVLLLFLNFRSWIETFIVMISVPFALVGSVWLMFFLGYNTSVAVWVGIIALVGVAAETGIVMIIYLDEYYHRYRAEGRINNSEDIRRAVIDGAVMRVRPKLMTVATATIGLAPLLWSQGAGSDVMGRIAAPMVGGLLTSAFLTLEIIPVIYMYWKRLELRGEVTRGVLVGLHEINGVTSIALALGLSAPWPSRVLLLMAGVVFVVLGVLLWRGNRTVRFALAALDLFAALVGAMGLWIAQGNWLAYLGPAVAAIVGFAMIAPSIAAQIDPAPHPNI